MSVYTTELRYICETYAGLSESQGYESVEDIIQKALPKIFDFSFPIFDESYRNVLETKIIRHFYTQEIGFETPGLWKLKLSTKLNEIMPYYNQLYNSELIEFNPLYDVDVTTMRKTTGSGSSDKTTNQNENRENSVDREISENITRNIDESENNDIQSNSTTDTGSDSNIETNQNTVKSLQQNHKQMYADTPQGAITDLESGRYMTNATVNINTDNESTNVTGKSESNESGYSNFEGNESRDVTRDREEKEERKNSDTQTGTGKITSTGSENNSFNNLEDYTEHVSGSTAGKSLSQRLIDFRNTFMNIDMMIIGELDELFMQLWY